MDLELSEVRIKLDQMSERIVSKLKDRSRYKHNKSVYLPDGIPIEGRSGISFLEFALEDLQNHFAKLGRYKYSDQHPLVSNTTLTTPVTRVAPQSPITKVGIDIKKNVIEFYVNSIREFCEPGEDPSTYGETVYCDSDLIHFLNERINLGRFAAEAKIKSDPSIREITNSEQLVKRIRRLEIEEKVVNDAIVIASRYGLDKPIVEKYFKWIIKETIEVEVAYLKQTNSRK